MDKYLDFATFSGLFNWSTRYLQKSKIAFNQRFPLVKLSSFLSRSKFGVVIQDNTIYRRVTIRVRNGGVIPRDEVVGSIIGTKKQFVVSKGQFIISKIDARNGAMGIVPQELDGAVVTQDFLAYNIDEEKINSQYLVLVSTTKQFVDFCQNCSSGTTNRQRVDEAKFLNIKIPLPSIQEQNELVKQFTDVNSDADLMDSQRRDAELYLTEYINDVLGLEFSKKNENSSSQLCFVRFHNTVRWDADSLLGVQQISSKYPLCPLQECISVFMRDDNKLSLRVDTQNTPQDKYRYIGMETVLKEIGRLEVEAEHLMEIKGEKIKSQALRLPKGYFIYGKLRPYLNKYWYNNTDYDNIICSSEFFVFKVKPEINIEYFKAIISSGFIQAQLADQMSGARMPRINEEIFLNLQVPIPPISLQREIAGRIVKTREESNNLWNWAAEKRMQAQIDFEKSIFEN